MDFSPFGKAVRSQVEKMMANNRLFVVDSDNDEIWQRYLDSFPEGTNPMFRTRTEHDCSCCRHFIRSVGNIVAIKNGVVETIWDVTGLNPAYQAVADSMAAYIRSKKVVDVFLTKFNSAGQPTSVELKDGKTRKWDHFAVGIARQFICNNPEEKKGELRAAHHVLKRGIEEITKESVQTVVELIENRELYRGDEFKQQVLNFQQLQNKLSGGNEYLLWENLDSPASRLRNSVMGTLLQDLSEGVDAERAVKSFESKVAPTGYKRPTSVITAKMAEDAMKTINELGLEPALERRHAKLTDVSINSVLWVDSQTKGKLRGGIADKLMEEVKPAAFNPKKNKPITIGDFLALPHKRGIQLYLDNSLLPNFMSVTAPVHSDVKSLFKWNNDFAWTYDGNVADSIKDKVKRAGGQVEGVALRASLAWYNYDDLDLHCESPTGELYYGNARPHILDVDANAGCGSTRQPVENMRWVKPPSGKYRFFVHNFSRREPIDVGFTMEVESELGLDTFRYDKSLANKERVNVCTVTVKNCQVVSVEPTSEVIHGAASQSQWGLKTLELVKVHAVIQSPNYWDDNAVGNKHWFFILEGCKNPKPCRGIYNEFLNPRLEKHRKVFEILGGKTMCPVADEQLSGVGFSSTRKDKVIAVSDGISYEISF